MAGALPASQTARMSIAAYLTATGWVDEPVIAAGHLRQRILRRCRLLPRQFVLAVTQTRVVVFQAWGDGYAIGIKPGVRAAFARHEIELTDLAEGPESTGAVMRVRGARFPVSRPKLDGDWDTDELIALLGGLPPLKAPQEPAWAAFSL
jgi:hypothetical protein